jgi:hypothetical protein
MVIWPRMTEEQNFDKTKMYENAGNSAGIFSGGISNN